MGCLEAAACWKYLHYSYSSLTYIQYYMCKLSVNAHLCRRDEVNCGMARLGSNRYDKGIWSVYMINLRPYKYWWNFFKPNIIANASLSKWEYLFSTGTIVREAYVMGRSDSAPNLCKSAALTLHHMIILNLYHYHNVPVPCCDFTTSKALCWFWHHW